MRANRPSLAVLATLAVVAWALGNHWLLVTSGGVGRGVELSLFSAAAFACWLGLRVRGPWRWSALSVSIALLVVLAWSRTHPGPNLALPIPQAAACLLVAAMFGSSLLPGREAVLARVARVVHGEISPAHADYARRVTWAWFLFLCAVAGVSILLFFAAPLALWSLFANLLTLPLLTLMLCAEYAYRALRRPDLPRVSMLAGVRGFRQLRFGSAERVP